MAKLTLSYASGIETRTLEFKGKTYSFSMIPNGTGSRGDKPCFDAQVLDAKEIAEDELYIIKALEDLSYENEDDEIFSLLKDLEEAE